MMFNGHCMKCRRVWSEMGKWPLACPYCGSLDVRRTSTSTIATARIHWRRSL